MGIDPNDYLRLTTTGGRRHETYLLENYQVKVFAAVQKAIGLCDDLLNLYVSNLVGPKTRTTG